MSEFRTSPEFERKMQELAARTSHMFIPRSEAQHSMAEMRFPRDPADGIAEEGRQVIPDEAVEAAANLIVQGNRGPCECRRSIFDKHDVTPPCSTRIQAVRIARAALEAAAPHMLREAWDDGHSAGVDHADGLDGGSNPYD